MVWQWACGSLSSFSYWQGLSFEQYNDCNSVLVTLIYQFSSSAFLPSFLLLPPPPGASLDSDMGPSAVFHPPSKETALASTSTFGPKSFLFIPQQVGLGSPLQSGVYCKDHKSTVSISTWPCSSDAVDAVWPTIK